MVINNWCLKIKNKFKRLAFGDCIPMRLNIFFVQIRSVFIEPAMLSLRLTRKVFSERPRSVVFNGAA